MVRRSRVPKEKTGTRGPKGRDRWLASLPEGPSRLPSPLQERSRPSSTIRQVDIIDGTMARVRVCKAVVHRWRFCWTLDLHSLENSG
jgi:hypothetical protein